MKKIDITLNINTMNQWDAERFYNKLEKGLNPLHPTATMHLKKKIVEQLGYTPEFK